MNQPFEGNIDVAKVGLFDWEEMTDDQTSKRYVEDTVDLVRKHVSADKSRLTSR